jgi:hypothetical protein
LGFKTPAGAFTKTAVLYLPVESGFFALQGKGRLDIEGLKSFVQQDFLRFFVLPGKPDLWAARPPRRLWSCVARPSIAGGIPTPLLRYSLPALQILRVCLFGPPNRCRTGGSSAGTECLIFSEIIFKIVSLSQNQLTVR